MRGADRICAAICIDTCTIFGIYVDPVARIGICVVIGPKYGPADDICVDIAICMVIALIAFGCVIFGTV